MVTTTQVVCALLMSPLLWFAVHLYFKMVRLILDEFKEIITKNK